MAFVASHLLNHALGLVSLEAMESGRGVFLQVWRPWPGTILLYGALFIHLGLAFWSIYQRQSWRLPPQDWWMLLLGVAIPPLLIIHILGNRVAHEVYGLEDNYHFDLLVYFVLDPSLGWRQVALLLITWLHGCIGLHFWFRLKPGYLTWRWPLFAFALLIPVFSLVGIWVAGQKVVQMASDPAWISSVLQTVNAPPAAQIASIYRLADWILYGLVAILLATFLARIGRRLWRARRGVLRVTYPDGRRVAVSRGTTILEASRSASIPHTSICGGKGRCSTCRVRIAKGPELEPPSPSESKVLARIGAAPNVRLACQTPVTDNLQVIPLLPPTASPRDGHKQSDYLRGDEREIAVLFADLRGFTSLSEHKLPYDVVFILNRYFAGMGKAVEEAGGRLDKFIGDGVMALFGVDKGPNEGGRQALAAARLMSLQLAELNRSLEGDLEAPLRIGIGIHIGPAIVGEMGYGQSVGVTAIGDTVNTASRLEALTKDFGAQLVVSETLMSQAGVNQAGVNQSGVNQPVFERRDIEVRGRRGKLGIFVIPDAQDLAL
ncbi:MAG: adenylate/guanylate cyclase domain-containing protein [Pseudomonadota bacterium]